MLELRRACRCWIVLGLVGIFAAITCFAGFQSDACFFIHYGLQTLSLLGYGASTVALFASRPAILRGINQRGWPVDRVDDFLRGVRWAFLATFGIHVRERGSLPSQQLLQSRTSVPLQRASQKSLFGMITLVAAPLLLRRSPAGCGSNPGLHCTPLRPRLRV